MLNLMSRIDDRIARVSPMNAVAVKFFSESRSWRTPMQRQGEICTE